MLEPALESPDSKVFHNEIGKGARKGDGGESRHASSCLQGKNKGKKGPEIKHGKRQQKGKKED